MKLIFALCACSLLALPSASGAQPRGFEMRQTSNGGASVTYNGFADKGVTYELSCADNVITAKELGVTSLMDPTDGTKIGDSAGSAIRPGAAMMALFTDRTKPAFTPAVAVPNIQNGWDLTIRLPMDDAAVRALPKAKAMSLMTTGWTGLVQLDATDRTMFSAFVEACSAPR
jgi:hypothetical protein